MNPNELNAKAYEIVEALGFLPVQEPVVSEEDALKIASYFKGVPQLFRRLDEQPGRYGYENSRGMTWHWKLRQARNRYYPQMAKVMFA